MDKFIVECLEKSLRLKEKLEKIDENKTVLSDRRGTYYFGGALNTLSLRFYGTNFLEPTNTRRRGKYSSSKREGEMLHRHIYHRHVCREACTCKSRFGKETRRKLTQGSKVQKMLESFDGFLKEYKLRVFSGEVEVIWCHARCTTAIDVLCVDDVDTPTSVYVIEIKTGYSTLKSKPRTTDGSGMMSGPAGSKIANCYANHHQLQLWLCVEALKETYDIQASGIILYLHPKHKFKVVREAKWWAEDVEFRKEMIKQIKPL